MYHIIPCIDCTWANKKHDINLEGDMENMLGENEGGDIGA
jgi:hypothetical protein